jgi:hypothetical protein
MTAATGEPYRTIRHKNGAQKKTPLGAVWDAPAGLKEAIQQPAQHRLPRLPGLRGGKTERLLETDENKFSFWMVRK